MRRNSDGVSLIAGRFAVAQGLQCLLTLAQHQQCSGQERCHTLGIFGVIQQFAEFCFGKFGISCLKRNPGVQEHHRLIRGIALHRVADMNLGGSDVALVKSCLRFVRF